MQQVMIMGNIIISNMGTYCIFKHIFYCKFGTYRYIHAIHNHAVVCSDDCLFHCVLRPHGHVITITYFHGGCSVVTTSFCVI